MNIVSVSQVSFRAHSENNTDVNDTHFIIHTCMITKWNRCIQKNQTVQHDQMQRVIRVNANVTLTGVGWLAAIYLCVLTLALTHEALHYV
jgi:hypothetical protein